MLDNDYLELIGLDGIWTTDVWAESTGEMAAIVEEQDRRRREEREQKKEKMPSARKNRPSNA